MSSGYEIIDVTPWEVAYLDKLLLGEDGRMLVKPHAFYQQQNPVHLRVWLNLHARYNVPTVELVDWLSEQIKGKTALEVGAGCGDLGYRLGITMTDSQQQVNEPATVDYIRLLGMKPTQPPPDVLAEDAENAVRKRKPDVVIAAWVTQRWKPGDEHGNMFGPREDYLLARCGKYILIGNENVHGQKRLLQVPHETHRFPWLVSRAQDQSKNLVYVWTNPSRWR